MVALYSILLWRRNVVICLVSNTCDDSRAPFSGDELALKNFDLEPPLCLSPLLGFY